MKKDNTKIIAGAAALTAIIAVAGIAASSYAFRGNFHEGKPNFNSEQHEAIKEAIENNNYEAWQELMAGKPMAEKITEENFAKLVEAHNLILDGKYEEARAIKKELGIGFGHIKDKGHGMWKEKGFHKFVDEDGDGQCDYKQE